MWSRKLCECWAPTPGLCLGYPGNRLEEGKKGDSIGNRARAEFISSALPTTSNSRLASSHQKPVSFCCCLLALPYNTPPDLLTPYIPVPGSCHLGLCITSQLSRSLQLCPDWPHVPSVHPLSATSLSFQKYLELPSLKLFNAPQPKIKLNHVGISKETCMPSRLLAFSFLSLP